MKLTLAELYLIIDTLKGSCSLQDNGRLFTFKREQRLELLNAMLEKMNKISINLDIKEE